MWKISTLTFCLRFLSHQNGLTNYFDFLISNIIPGGERGGVQITCTMACEKNLRSDFMYLVRYQVSKTWSFFLKNLLMDNWPFQGQILPFHFPFTPFNRCFAKTRITQFLVGWKHVLCCLWFTFFIHVSFFVHIDTFKTIKFHNMNQLLPN